MPSQTDTTVVEPATTAQVEAKQSSKELPSVKVPEPVTDLRDAFHYTDLQTNKPTRVEDPYEYQSGWGNRIQSEIIPGTLPAGQNNPQLPRFKLYTEGLTSSAFSAPRAVNSSTYMYRCRPSVANHGYSSIKTKAHLESCFLTSNPRVKMMPAQYEWPPFELPSKDEEIDFIDGLHTVGGSGDANLREGLAFHCYMINKAMDHRAFMNADGDFLIVAQLGNLDIKTELGKIYLQPGEVAVVQRGIKYCINPAPGTQEARGYIFEVWGSRWELPDLGPIGGHGNANARDFLFPVAAMDEELHEEWKIVEKINGEYHMITQDHSPFDVAAWHGNCVPYKYDMTKFSPQGSIGIDHTDPSVWTMLTARSRDPNTPLVDFIWFGPKWDVASNTFRLPYFHRNAASELIANVYGKGGGRSGKFMSGGGSYEAGHTAHGGFSDPFVNERRRMVNEPRIFGHGNMTFMVESSRSFLFTEWGLKAGHDEATDPAVWDRMPDQFSTDPKVRALLKRVQTEKALRRQNDEAYYHDDRLDELLQKPLPELHINGDGNASVNGNSANGGH